MCRAAALPVKPEYDRGTSDEEVSVRTFPEEKDRLLHSGTISVLAARAALDRDSFASATPKQPERYAIELSGWRQRRHRIAAACHAKARKQRLRDTG
jgi:hypothetical protein